MKNNNLKGNFEKFTSKMELMGQTAANKAHRYFINLVFAFMAYNVYYFVTTYN